MNVIESTQSLKLKAVCWQILMGVDKEGQEKVFLEK